VISGMSAYGPKRTLARRSANFSKPVSGAAGEAILMLAHDLRVQRAA
jgi:hypothetical protein